MDQHSPARRHQAWIFGLTIFVSAFLLFQVQPMIGKRILPWFGGGPAVWTTSMLFFQVLLLGGYAYAHGLDRLKARRQVHLHLFVLALALGWMGSMTFLRSTPITPEESLQPLGDSLPVRQVLLVLTASIGIPYFLLSTTSSLAQVWFSKIEQRSSPYVFYALSNAASLFALLSYPVLFEPAWSLKEQASFWSIGFIVYLALVGLCAALLLRAAGAGNAAREPGEQVERQPAEYPNNEAPKPTITQYLVWIGLSAVPSVMLLAVTNQITQDVAAVPFLWVLPLSIYLLSFVLAFSDRLQFLWNAYIVASLIACWIGYISLELLAELSLVQLIAANAILLLTISLLCHSMLYRLRPHPRYLTSFYLMLAIGGALGGALISLVAPAIFADYWEYPLGLIVITVVTVILAFRSTSYWLSWLRTTMAIAGLALILFLTLWIRNVSANTLYVSRNFYGVLRIRDITYQDVPVRNLVHGQIIHGSQSPDPAYSDRPTRYYSPSTGIGLAFTDHVKRAEGQPLRAGMVGLGAGTVAVYGQPGDIIRFYEINPDVIEIAQDPHYFTFLTDSAAAVEIVQGDARLSMERELREGRPQSYDLLAIDAFSGDSIPTHLIDREAVALYLQHLAEDGILAFHISNLYLDLEPVVARLAIEFGLSGGTIVSGKQDWLGTNATWVLLSRSPVAIGTPAITAAKRSMIQKPGLPLWTDDFSNMFQALR